MTDRPELLLEAEGEDPLSEMLAWVRLRGGRVFQTSLASGQRLPFTAGPSHLHVVEEGSLALHCGHEGPVLLVAGEVVLLPHGSAHDLAVTSDNEAPVRLLSAQFHFDRKPLPPLLNNLPPVMKVSFPNGQLPGWLNATTFFLLDEVSNRAPGSALMLSRIVDLMVIRTLRAWAASGPSTETWLGCNRDTRLGRALVAMHHHPEEAWTVASLADLSGMSRSVFAERFNRAFGEPPLRYLARWRIALAQDLLETTDASIGEISFRVGYGSEPGFSRAFKAMTGEAPSALRMRGAPAVSD
ncbi:cupin domain-containing protein [Arenibacterium sp. LLYu02]|uniref:AraC family transcriptional regulator n=1 Tax=Arenibacterium sp. LLYu02 TaxID=3404132 RepID=UPI003B224B02